MIPSAVVSASCRIRHPDEFQVGAHSIVDDFSYFSTKVRIGMCSHIASGCSVAGGIRFTFSLGDFSSLSSGVKVWCSSNNFSEDLVMIMPAGFSLGEEHPIQGDVTFANYTGAGANAVIMPDNRIPEGAVIGALSFVPSKADLQPWTVYAGTPVRAVKARNRDNVLRQAEKVREWLARNPS
jgi:acetyltransferase-like isoleucine patch superfamily enzyme